MKRKKKFLLILVIISFGIIIGQSKIAFGGEIEKTVYLTFDDGPSTNNTEKVLEILNKNDVKGTFFVVGKNVQKNKEKIKKMYESGMTISPHCNIHNYQQLYKNKESYFYDLENCDKNLKAVLGNEYKFNFVRLPGGATNEVSKFDVKKSILTELQKKNVSYIDWNVDSGDAEAVNVSTNKLKNNFKRNCGRYKVEVVLMHDTDAKDSTVLTLQELITNYKNLGYEFKKLDDITEEEFTYLENTRVLNRKYN